jgi:hypothetical protein
MFKKYIEYLKDNPEGYWFKRKLYGWGWTPAKWQGWAVLLVSVILILWNGLSLGKVAQPTDGTLTWFFVKTVIVVVALLVVCYKKGEKPGWRWGIPDKK